MYLLVNLININLAYSNFVIFVKVRKINNIKREEIHSDSLSPNMLFEFRKVQIELINCTLNMVLVNVRAQLPI